MANKKISGYTEVTTYDDTSFYLLENSSGYYRKQSSARLARVITSDVVYTIGTGGDFANFVLAMDFLKNKIIATNVTVTLRLCSDLNLTTPESYTWSWISHITMYAALYMDHPCSSRIIIDMAGYDITIGNGTDTCHGFIAGKNKTLYIYPTINGSIITTAKNGYGYGIYAKQNSSIHLFTESNRRITIGASGYGFANGIMAEYHGTVISPYLNLYFNIYGGFSQFGGFIDGAYCDVAENTSGVGWYATTGGQIRRNGSTGTQAVSVVPNMETLGNYNSYVS